MSKSLSEHLDATGVEIVVPDDHFITTMLVIYDCSGVDGGGTLRYAMSDGADIIKVVGMIETARRTIRGVLHGGDDE